MLKALVAVSIVCSLAAQGLAQGEARRTTLTGTFERIPEFESKALGNKRDLLIYLPPQYASEPKRRFPVLYLHDGQNVFDGATSYLPNREWRADESAEMLIRAGLIEPIIIVAIPNMGVERANEFLPTRARAGNQEAGGKADLYAKMLRDEIKPEIDRRFRTKRDAANTAVGGSSFGGIVTLHICLTYPETFGKGLVVSPSVWWDDRVMLKRVAEHKGRRAKLWVDMGEGEGQGAAETGQALYFALEKNGWKPGQNLIYVQEGFAQHNEDAWARRFPTMLQFLFGTKRS